VIAVRYDERQAQCEVAADNKNGRERLCLVYSLQVRIHMRIVTGQKRELRRPQQVLGFVLDDFRLAEGLTIALTLASGPRSERYFRAASKSEAAPSLVQRSCGLLMGEVFSCFGIRGMKTGPPGVNPRAASAGLAL
jgi:hypothetical protein